MKALSRTVLLASELIKVESIYSVGVENWKLKRETVNSEGINFSPHSILSLYITEQEIVSYFSWEINKWHLIFSFPERWKQNIKRKDHIFRSKRPNTMLECELEVSDIKMRLYFFP